MAWRAVQARRRRLLAVGGAVWLGLLTLPFALLAGAAGRPPNYVKGFDLGGWAGDITTLAMPLGRSVAAPLAVPQVCARSTDPTGYYQQRSNRARRGWSALLKRVFAIDVPRCDTCGGQRRIVGVYTGGERLRFLLQRLGSGDPSMVRGPSRSPPGSDRPT